LEPTDGQEKVPMTMDDARTAADPLAQTRDRLRVMVCGPAGERGSSLIGRLLPPGGTPDDGPEVDVVRSLRDLVAAAPRADVAVIAADGRDGLTVPLLRDVAVAGLMGVRRAVLAINGQKTRIREIERAFAAHGRTFGIAQVVAIPLPRAAGGSAAWHRDPALHDLFAAAGADRAAARAFRFLVTGVDRDAPGTTRCAGTVRGGAVAAGERVRVWPSGAEAAIARIAAREGEAAAAAAGDAVTLALDGEVEASPGDVIAAAADTSIAVADQFQAALIWLSDEPMVPGRRYWARIGTAECGAEVTTLKHRLDFATDAQASARSLASGEVGVATLTLDLPRPFDSHAVNPDTGSVALLDPDTGVEVGFGIIEYALRRATNVVWHDTAVDKTVRAQLKGQKPVCLWFTGLSGSGKSTVANMVDKRLTAEQRHTYVLDGDNIRHGLNHDLGFTEADRVENIRRMAEVAKLMVDAGLIVMVCAISPYHRDREMARGLFEDGEFIEVFVDTPLGECESRDPKGLYQKARAGQIPNFTGISAPYEAPEAPEIRLEGTRSIDELVERVFEKLG